MHDENTRRFRPSTGLLCALLALAALWLGACAGTTAPASDPGTTAAEPSSERSFTLVSINDIYRISGLEDGTEGGPARVRALRAELERDHPELLVFHAGDFLYPSLLSRSYDGEQMISVLNLLDGEPEGFDSRFFITFGNHEFDVSSARGAEVLDRRLAESQFRWLTSNVVFAAGGDGHPVVAGPNLVDHLVVDSGGIQVGIFALTLDSQNPSYVDSFVDPIATARDRSARLRALGAEVVIGLTHLQLEDDLLLLETLADEGPDLLLGGHEHERKAERAGGRWVFKADADARSAVVATVVVEADGAVRVEHRFAELEGDSPAPDPQVEALAAAWQARHDLEYCVAHELPEGCLDQVLGHTRTRLGGEEIAIRSRETSLGNWVADRLLDLHAAGGAQVAVVNAGALRLNRDLAADSDILRRDIEELFAFPSRTELLEIDAETLVEVIETSVEGSGEGRWLQVAGVAFRRDPDRRTVSGVTLLTPDGPRPLAPGEKVRLATVSYLVDPKGDQDGYTMLRPEQRLATGGELKDAVVEALTAAGAEGIAPRVEGRVCTAGRPGPCLAVGG